jgi:hypothetical protein
MNGETRKESRFTGLDSITGVKKLHTWVVLVMGIVSPVGTGFAAWYNMKSSVDERFSQVRIERERDFVKKDDLKELSRKINEIAEDVAFIKGRLRGR